MTEMLNKEFSRKAFVKGGGAMVVGFSLTGAAQAANGNTPFAARGPGDFLPNLSTIDAWIAIRPDNTVMVTHGETELGHGTPTGILMMVAEELDVDMSQMVYNHPETWLNATGGGGGSGGISQRSTQTRAAAAYAKQELLKMASTKLGVPVASLTVAKGVVSGGSGKVTYGELVGGKLFSINLTTTTLQHGVAPAKPVSAYKLVGTKAQRVDIPSKVLGKFTYTSNVTMPGIRTLWT